jgi:hypothetical protein
MPAEKDLPAEVAALSRCQYRRLRHREASAGLARLVSELIEIEPRLGMVEAFPPHGRVVVGKPPALADAFQERPELRADHRHGGAELHQHFESITRDCRGKSHRGQGDLR